MRLDLFLSITGVFKTRTIAGKACRTGHVTLNGSPAKPAREVKQGDLIGSMKPDGTPVSIRVAAIPASKQVSRKDRGLYVEYVSPGEEPPC